MGYVSFWKGVRPSQNLTLKAGRWAGYLCWWLEANLRQLPPMPSTRLYRLANYLTPRLWARVTWAGRDTEVAVRSGAEANGWEPLGSVALHLLALRLRKPGCLCNRLVRWRGPFGHRCDWTDRQGGRLYGGQGGAIDALFEQFIGNISITPAQAAAVETACAQFQGLVLSHGQEVN